MICAGFDPGFRESALGVVDRTGDKLRLIHRGRIRTKPKQSQKECERVIWDALSGSIRLYHPVALGIEDQAGVSAGARGRLMAAAKSGKPVKGGFGFNAGNDNVTGAVFLAKGCAIAYGVDYELFQPKSIKIAVCGKGAGSAEKSAMIAAIELIFPELVGQGVSDHEADALAIAVLMCRALALRVRA